ncbi:MAG: ATP-dependent zinc metalloprotease FtsH, partial [Cyanobacteria bacterium MAG CAR2_bin_4]|nr:ATP-dependent zinc metalloprotease FtsH [Cyanobacteria bacterium MAG CAR2_bin_4]
MSIFAPALGQPGEPLGYSGLVEAVRNGQAQELLWNPDLRKVRVTLLDGRQSVVDVFPENPVLIQEADAAGVPLTIEDSRQQEAWAGLMVNLLLVALILVGLGLLLRRSAKAANRALGFGRSKPCLRAENDIRVCFEDVAGINEAKDELQEVVAFLKQPDRFTSIGARIPRGVLLVGPPGTGKTLLARAVAAEAGVEFFSISASEFVEMFVGVGASRVRDLFRQAKQKAPCIVFIDEIDAVGRQRGAGIGGGNDEREQTLNQLLTEMDGFEDNSGIILLAATNRPDVLDTALLRPGRFDRRVLVDLPDRPGREAILNVHARTRPMAPDVDLAAWACRTPGFSGADLANLLNEAAILTARARKQFIEDNHIMDALERVTMGLPAAPLQNSGKKWLIAYHEVGHALVATLLHQADDLDKVTLLPRSGGVGGFARFTPDEEVVDSGLVSRAKLQARMAVSMGGRAAELVVFGRQEITPGASRDIEAVTATAREMVTRYGFSSLGPVAWEGDQAEVFIGRDWLQQRPTYSKDTAKALDAEVQKLAKEALAAACSLLAGHRPLLDELTNQLVEEETIGGDQFRAVVEQYQGTTA